MALKVEDGTGRADANAYIDVAYADAYFSARANADWSGAEPAKEAAIILATDYINVRWGQRLKGRREFPTVQALDFPRLGLRDNDGYLIRGIPENLRRAVAEYALRALAGSLMPDPAIDETGQRVNSRREKIGPIEEEVNYMAWANAIMEVRPYPAADRLMREFITFGGRAIR